MATSLEEVKLDLQELVSLSQSAKRSRVKQILHNEIARLEAEIRQREQVDSAASRNPPVKSPSGGLPHAYDVKLVNYAWDQSEKFVKIFVTVNGVQNVPAENVKTSFQEKSMELRVQGLENKNYFLVINNLTNNIRPSESYHKVKTDQVVVFLKKDKTKEWPCITAAESKSIESKTPKMDEDEDPGKSLMNLMKKMYDEGDDEMKRTIAKAWVEARDKQSQGEYNF